MKTKRRKQRTTNTPHSIVTTKQHTRHYTWGEAPVSTWTRQPSGVVRGGGGLLPNSIVPAACWCNRYEAWVRWCRSIPREQTNSIIRVSMCDRTMWPSQQSCYQPHAKVNSKGIGNWLGELVRPALLVGVCKQATSTLLCNRCSLRKT